MSSFYDKKALLPGDIEVCSSEYRDIDASIGTPVNELKTFPR
jgi:hypothetical protein